MAAPNYVPAPNTDPPRRSLPMPPPRRWMADRPGDLRTRQPSGPQLGSQGPDQGYAFALAERFADKLKLTPGEHREEVLAGCAALAMKRASLFGRAPVIHDLEVAFRLFGYLDENAPADLVEHRRMLFAGAAHDYWDRQALVDMVPEPTLRLKPDEVSARLSDWRSLLAA